jgi:SHS2 domain-containing protein
MNNTDKEFEFLEHTADIKIRVTGRTLNDIFENSVKAISQYVSGNQKIESKKGKVIEVSGSDMESLLYNFLDEILYLIDAESFLPIKAEVTLRGNNLKAELYGDSTKGKSLDHIKAPTYAEMSIKKVNSSWEAIFVLDV